MSVVPSEIWIVCPVPAGCGGRFNHQEPFSSAIVKTRRSASLSVTVTFYMGDAHPQRRDCKGSRCKTICEATKVGSFSSEAEHAASQRRSEVELNNDSILEKGINIDRASFDYRVSCR